MVGLDNIWVPEEGVNLNRVQETELSDLSSAVEKAVVPLYKFVLLQMGLDNENFFYDRDDPLVYLSSGIFEYDTSVGNIEMGVASQNISFLESSLNAGVKPDDFLEFYDSPHRCMKRYGRDFDISNRSKSSMDFNKYVLEPVSKPFRDILSSRPPNIFLYTCKLDNASNKSGVGGYNL